MLGTPGHTRLPVRGLGACCVCTLCTLTPLQQNTAGSVTALLTFLLQSNAKPPAPEKKRIHLIRFSHHIHLDPRDIVLPPGNTGEGLLQSVTNSCREGFTHVTVMLCKIKFSLTKSSCKGATILVSNENLNDWVVCWV